jgi:ABC-type molybdate transport system permease subunit
MIKAIANKKIDLTQEEYDYYLELEATFGKEAFIGLFKTNKYGTVVSVTPSSAIPTAIILIFFFLNIMLNQRLRSIDEGLSTLASIEKRISKIEEKIS